MGPLSASSDREIARGTSNLIALATLCLRIGAVVVGLNRQRPSRAVALAATAWLIALLPSGCSTPFPMNPGFTLSLARSAQSLQAEDLNYNSALQIHWFGTACYMLQLGGTAILVDPYFSYQPVGSVLFGRVRSDPNLIRCKLAPFPQPRSIFVSHSHYDHLLDAAEVRRQPGWEKVAIFGSRSTRNILAGYGDEFAAAWRESLADGQWHSGGAGVRYRAILSGHAPQLPGVRLYTGEVETRRSGPPERADDFKGGETFAYLFELSNDVAAYRIYLTAAPSEQFQSLPRSEVQPIDVALLCVADWQLAQGYPDECIRALRPREIVASHFDDFLLLSSRRRAVVPYANLDGFLQHVQRIATYPEFRAVRVPDIDSTIIVTKPRSAPQ